MVGPNREAFRPGTEPRAPSPPPAGSKIKAGDQPFAITPLGPPPMPPPPPFEPPKADRPPARPNALNGLY
jgi:hypothetical protein